MTIDRASPAIDDIIARTDAIVTAPEAALACDAEALAEVERRAATELAHVRDEAAVAIASAADAHQRELEARDATIAELQEVHERLFARQAEEMERARAEALAKLEAELEAKRRRDLDEASAAHAQALADARAESENLAVHAGRAVAAAHAQSALALAHALATHDEATTRRLEAVISLFR